MMTAQRDNSLMKVRGPNHPESSFLPRGLRALGGSRPLLSFSTTEVTEKREIENGTLSE
jgi:hypothetical protein